MITNLVASIVVTLVTNTTELFPEHQVPDLATFENGTIIGTYNFHMEYDKDPHQKWVRTQVIRRTILNFEWHGVQQTSSDEILSDTEQEFTLKRTDEWTTNGLDEIAWSASSGPHHGFIHIYTNRIGLLTNGAEFLTNNVMLWTTNLPFGYNFLTNK